MHEFTLALPIVSLSLLPLSRAVVLLGCSIRLQLNKGSSTSHPWMPPVAYMPPSLASVSSYGPRVWPPFICFCSSPCLSSCAKAYLSNPACPTTFCLCLCLSISHSFFSSFRFWVPEREAFSYLGVQAVLFTSLLILASFFLPLMCLLSLVLLLPCICPQHSFCLQPSSTGPAIHVNLFFCALGL